MHVRVKSTKVPTFSQHLLREEMGCSKIQIENFNYAEDFKYAEKERKQSDGIQGVM